MNENHKQALKGLFQNSGVTEAIDELKADLTRKALDRNSDEPTRTKNRDMLWGLEALVVKMRANIDHDPEDQAE